MLSAITRSALDHIALTYSDVKIVRPEVYRKTKRYMLILHYKFQQATREMEHENIVISIVFLKRLIALHLEVALKMCAL